jgi:hypothetical protein
MNPAYNDLAGRKKFLDESGYDLDLRSRRGIAG